MIQFYAPDIESSGVLPEGESAHCCRVLRMKAGDEIYVTDGKGHRFLCKILKAHPTHTEVVLKDKILISNNKNSRVTLAIAPTKNAERMEWLVEKAVELGVDVIVLFKCRRSERKIMKSERLRKVMISAMKQSLGTVLPELIELTDFSDYIKNECSDQKYFGYCDDEYPRQEFAAIFIPDKDVSIMIGPEGDFSPEEVATAVSHGFVPVTFGNRRLRTETAGVFAISAVNAINQRLK